MVMILNATKKELIVKEGSTIYSITPETATPEIKEALKQYQQKNEEKPTKKTTTTKKADDKKQETTKKTTPKKKTSKKKQTQKDE
jgi:topoisomerase IA-like protein